MDAHGQTDQGLEARMSRLERQNRRWRTATGLVVAAAGSLLLMAYSRRADPAAGGARAAQFKQVDVEGVVLRDVNGQMRAWLGIAEGGPRILFYDSTGQQRAGLGLTAQGEPALGFFDGSQNPRAVLGMLEGWPGLVLRDPAGKKRVALHSRAQWASLDFFDARETKRSGIGLYEDAAAINLSDDRGKERSGLTTDRSGSSLCFFDVTGKKRVGFGLLERDEPALGFFDPDGRPQVGLSVFAEKPELSLNGTNQTGAAVSAGMEGPRVQLYGENRRSIWTAP
jgi:hypothetical protein